MIGKAKSKENPSWQVDSWRNLPIRQQPEYPEKKILEAVEKELRSRPPLILPKESEALKNDLARVAEGKAFLLQGGDCAESFKEFSQVNLKQYFRVLLQMTVVLMYGAGKPIVKVGRIAGQFAKPRSDATETLEGKVLPSYRGDMVNDISFDEKARIPDPERLLKAYEQASTTIHYLRSLAEGGYASLRNVNEWNKEFTEESQQRKLFQDLTNRINEGFAFMEAWGLDLDTVSQFKTADFYTSHEALLLHYEQALTRLDKTSSKYYDCSAHMVWIGDRTRNPEEAHVEFMRGIANPIAFKVGPSMKEDDLIRLLDILNPGNEAGRITLISRMGSEKVGELLPPLIRRVKQEGRSVVWSCDPMHGNTVKSPNGYKTRHFNKILAEVRNVFAIHQAEGTYAGGIHIEMTGQDVTECVGGAQAISEVNLKDRYHTHCDPRLNASQSIELAYLIAEALRKH